MMGSRWQQKQARSSGAEQRREARCDRNCLLICCKLGLNGSPLPTAAMLPPLKCMDCSFRDNALLGLKCSFSLLCLLARSPLLLFASSLSSPPPPRAALLLTFCSSFPPTAHTLILCLLSTPSASHFVRGVLLLLLPTRTHSLALAQPTNEDEALMASSYGCAGLLTASLGCSGSRHWPRFHACARPN